MPSRPRLAFCTTVLSALACFISGCTNETRDGDTTVFVFALWVPALALLGGVVVFILGILSRRKSTRWGFGLMISGLIMGAVVAPDILLEKATVNPARFTKRTGFWFASTVHDVQFADLSRIELIAEGTTSWRGSSRSDYLVCYRKSGTSDEVPLGDLMKQGAAARTLEKAREHGVAVVDKR